MRTLSLVVLLCAATTFAAEITTVAGTGKPEDNGDGPALEANVGEPFGVEVGPDGALYITEVRNHRVRRLDPRSGQLSTVAGTGKQGFRGDGGLATGAELNEPYELRFDAEGNMLFVEMKNHLVRRVDAKTGIVSTIAGTGKEGFSGDGGKATEAAFRQPHSIALDDAGNLYIADILNHRIRRVSPDGKVATIAGDGRKELPVDGSQASGNPVLGPRSLFVQGGMLWVCLREGNSVWKLNLARDRWHHVAGTGKKGYSGDGGDAKVATFDGPKGIALDAAGNVLIVDTENQAIRRIDAKSGIITTVAGSGSDSAGRLGDGGNATEARLARPHGICIGPDGAIYIGDTNHHRVRRVAGQRDQ
jgi:streptogramin lyase